MSDMRRDNDAEVFDSADLQQAYDTGMPLADGSMMVVRVKSYAPGLRISGQGSVTRIDTQMRSEMCFSFEHAVPALWVTLAQQDGIAACGHMTVTLRNPNKTHPTQCPSRCLIERSAIAGPLIEARISLLHAQELDVFDLFESLSVGAVQPRSWPLARQEVAPVRQVSHKGLLPRLRGAQRGL